ncbi:MAG: hypothetical protein VXZ45_05000 [Verrucomicrobiota bacterium]|nr:hypothetical protein [Verrucomicrobiota bacterium]
MNYLSNTRKALDLANDKLSKADTFGALSVMYAALEHIVAHLQKVDLNDHPEPDLTITFEEDCGEDDKE